MRINLSSSDVNRNDETACRIWEISENLHRAELPQLERDKLVAEWCALTGISRQPDEKISRGRPQSGNADAARQLGLSEPDVRRAVKVASLTPEAQETAREVGLDLYISVQR